MLRSVIYRLYEIDKIIIEQMAREEIKLFPGSEYPMFSYNAGAVKGNGDKKIKGTDIYQSTSFSSSFTLYIVKELLDRYEIDQNEFLYSAKLTVSETKDENK